MSFYTHEWTWLLSGELCWSQFLRLTRPTESPCADALRISWTVLCFCCNSRYQFPDTVLSQGWKITLLWLLPAYTSCAHTHFYTLLAWLWRRAVIKQPIFHSSSLSTTLRNFSAFYPTMPLAGESKSPKNCMTLHRGPKISSQNKARPLYFPLFDSTLFLKTTVGEVYILLDIQVPFFV